MTLEELTRLQAANDKRIKEAQRVILKHEHQLKYDALKDEILSSSYTEGEIDVELLKLKAIAHSIDHYGAIQKDYERFVAKVQTIYLQYRIAR